MGSAEKVRIWSSPPSLSPQPCSSDPLGPVTVLSGASVNTSAEGTAGSQASPTAPGLFGIHLSCYTHLPELQMQALQICCSSDRVMDEWTPASYWLCTALTQQTTWSFQESGVTPHVTINHQRSHLPPNISDWVEYWIIGSVKDKMLTKKKIIISDGIYHSALKSCRRKAYV